MLCRELLRRSGWWDPQGPIGFGCRWSDESLAKLFESWPGPASVPRLAAELLAVVAKREACERIIVARRRLDAALWRLLMTDESPKVVGPAELGMERAA